MFSRILVGAVMVLTAMAGALAAPAQASPAGNVGVAAARYVNLSPSDWCPDGYFCAFEEQGIIGRGVGFYATEANWGAIPSEFRWINNRARSGWNVGTFGPLDDVRVYSLPNFVDASGFPGTCIPVGELDGDWGNLRPESNKWFDNC
jgi:hypothetical protein